MLFVEELRVLWSSLEMFMAFSHLFVFLGIRNSKFGFLRRQHNYFLFDGLCHLTNLLTYSIGQVGMFLYTLWIIAFVIHMYYYQNLKSNPPLPTTGKGETVEDNKHKIPKIFHWSCVEYQANRFSIWESGREMLETTIDVTAHSAGFYLAFRILPSVWHQIAVLTIGLAILYNRMINMKYFLTDPKMMPSQIRRLAQLFSSA